MPRLLFGRFHATLLTSATLAIGGHFRYLKERLGLEGAAELVGGHLWAELVATGATDDLRGKPRGLARVFDEVHDWFRKGWRRSDPKGYWIGPKAAEAWKRNGLVLREPGHKGRSYGVWR